MSFFQKIMDLIKGVGPKAKEPRATFNVLIANLEGDILDKSGMAIMKLLDKQAFLSTAVYPKDFKFPIDEEEPGKTFFTVKRKGKKILEKTKADLLIWGHLKEDFMHIHFLAANEPELGHGIFENIDKLVIPADADDRFKLLLYACTLCSVVPTDKIESNTQKSALPEIIENFETSFAKVPDIQAEHKAHLFICLSNIYRFYGKLFEKEDVCKKAVNYCQKALFEINGDMSHKQTWAAGQIQLGNALMQMSSPDEEENSEKNSPHEDAVLAFEEVIKNMPSAYYPDEIARTYTKIGKALYNIAANQKRDDGLIKKAVVSIKSAEKVWKVEQNPVRWADLQDVLGRITHLRAIMTIIPEKKTELFEKSLKYFRNALVIRDMDEDPMFSAHTRNNLASVLLSYGDFKGELSILKECRQELYKAEEAFKTAEMESAEHLVGRNLLRCTRALEPFDDQLRREAKEARLIAERALEELMEEKMQAESK